MAICLPSWDIIEGMKDRRWRFKTIGVIGLLGCGLFAAGSILWRQSVLNHALVDAVEKGDIMAAERALRAGASPNARHVYINQPGNPIEYVQWALRSDNIVWHDCPVLSEACQSAQPVPLAKALLNQGADPNGNSKIGLTALLEVIEQDNVPVVQLLIEYGADVNARTPQGDTALMRLAANQFATVRSLPLLIAYGTELHAKNKEGKTALQLAVEYKRWPAVRLLKQAGAKE
jgi:hypothetical protein